MNYVKYISGIFGGLLTLCVIALGGAMIWGYQAYHHPQSLAEPVFFNVKQGESLKAIAHNLERQNLIAHDFVFELAVRAKGAENDLKAGEYRFSGVITPKHIFEKIRGGDVYLRQITIPEGLTSYEIVQLLNAFEDLGGGPIAFIPPEGSLLPETYTYQRGLNRGTILSRMKKSMRSALDQICAEYDCEDNAYLSDENDILTLASIIEKETALSSERRRVAGVFINRLERGMKLQTDPTVIYGITKGRHENEGRGPLGRRLLRKDLKYDSPYNTYLNEGLPPGPIANPGRASIEAALNPEAHEYIFFVADGSGGHAFAKTLAEHNKNAAKWRKVRGN